MVIAVTGLRQCIEKRVTSDFSYDGFMKSPNGIVELPFFRHDMPLLLGTAARLGVGVAFMPCVWVSHEHEIGLHEKQGAWLHGPDPDPRYLCSEMLELVGNMLSDVSETSALTMCHGCSWSVWITSHDTDSLQTVL